MYDDYDLDMAVEEYIQGIVKILKVWKMESGYKKPILYKERDGILTVYLSSPGYLIGKAGWLIEKYSNILKIERGINDIKFEEVDCYAI